MRFWSRVRAALVRQTNPGFCPKCGRPRLSIPTLTDGVGVMYVPPNAWELEHRCVPQSCQWYDEPSVPEDPHVRIEKPRSNAERRDDIEAWVRRNRAERDHDSD